MSRQYATSAGAVTVSRSLREVKTPDERGNMFCLWLNAFAHCLYDIASTFWAHSQEALLYCRFLISAAYCRCIWAIRRRSEADYQLLK